MTTEVQAMWDRLPVLAERETSLRMESHGCAYPAVGDDDIVVTVVSNRARLDEIKLELAAIASERSRIQNKLQKLKELLGDNDPGCIPIPGGECGYIARLKADLGQRFFHKILTAHNPWMTPEEAIASAQYLAVKNEIMPKIAEVEARDKEATRLSAAANQILRAA